MDKDDNILDRIREMLGKTGENFSILEHQVDVKVQMDYFEFSKNHTPSHDHDKVIGEESLLYSPEVSDEEKKALLVSLASIDKPEAYRVIERYNAKATLGLKDWSVMALQESRMLLETRLLDEQQVFISTGLGGKGSKLRYFVVIFPTTKNEFTDTQKRIINSEFKFTLKRFESDVEDINFYSRYATIVALVPLSVHVRLPFEGAIDECNLLGEFIGSGFLITNVKKLNQEEIEDVINNPSKYKNED